MHLSSQIWQIFVEWFDGNFFGVIAFECTFPHCECGKTRNSLSPRKYFVKSTLQYFFSKAVAFMKFLSITVTVFWRHTRAKKNRKMNGKLFVDITEIFVICFHENYVNTAEFTEIYPPQCTCHTGNYRNLLSPKKNFVKSTIQ